MTIHLSDTTIHPSLDSVDIVEVPVRRATKENFSAYGRIVKDFDAEEVEIKVWPQPGWRKIDPGTGNEGGITEGPFDIYRKGDVACAENHAVNGHYIIGWFGDPARAATDKKSPDITKIYTREANYHPDGGQVFYPRNGKPFISLLALPGDDVKPSDFVAFYCDGSFGIQIKPDIWHQPPYSIEDRMTFDDKQGAVHACISVDFISEFGCYLSFDLSDPET